MPKVSKDLACTLFEQLLEPVEDNLPPIPSGKQGTKQAGRVDDAAGTGRASTATTDPAAVAAQTRARYVSNETPTMTELLGGGS